MEVLYGKEARDIVEKALDIAYNSVCYTLGPKGSNAVAVIDGKTTITNDGVSIVKQLQLPEEMNVPLNIIKEACFNAESKSGDGTTTAIVVTKSIFDLGKKEIEKGSNPIVLRNSIFKAFDYYSDLIRKQKTEIKSSKDVMGVATVSSGGNKQIGMEIAKAFALVNFKGNVDYKIDPSIEGLETDYLKGYQIKSDYLGYDTFDLKNMSDIKIMIYEGNISSANDVKELAAFNRYVNNTDTIIVMSNFEKDALETLMLYNNAGNKILPFSLPSFGLDREKTLDELSLITGAPYLDKEVKFSKFLMEDFKEAYGVIKKCIIKKNNILLLDIYEDDYPVLFKKLEENNKSKKEEIENGVAIIRVGGRTQVEAEETLLRIQDAVNSTKLALNNGIIISGANTMYKLSMQHDYTQYDIGFNILTKALRLPIKLICDNAGYKVPEFDLYGDIGFNAESGSVENLMETGIIDPVDTVINSLKSAVSIATSLLTINCIIKEGGNKKW